MHKKYVIQGDLTQFVKMMFEDRRRVWDSIMEFRTLIEINLRNQHDTALFKGPIGVLGAFFLPYPKEIPPRKRIDRLVHMRRPPMSSLIYFVEHVASGIVFGNGCSIVSVSCQKYYTTEEPRVELEIFSV